MFIVVLVMTDEYDIHILVAGDPQVGKSWTCGRLALVPKEELLNTTRTVMGEGLKIKYEWPDYAYMVLKLTDIAGDQHARSLVRMYYRNLDGVLLVCDVSRPETLTSLKEEWLKEIEKYYVNGTMPRFMLIVNKCDLPDDQKKITEKDIDLFCQENHIHCHVMSSAMTWSWATNPTPIEEFFLALVQEKRMKRPVVDPAGPSRLRLRRGGGDRESFKDKAVDELKSNCAFCS